MNIWNEPIMPMMRLEKDHGRHERDGHVDEAGPAAGAVDFSSFVERARDALEGRAR